MSELYNGLFWNYGYDSLRKEKNMVLRYLYKLNPEDEKAEVIMEADTLAPMVSCIEHFWNNLGARIPYFRLIDFEDQGVVIDFGHHYRFYHVTGYSGTIEEFVTEWEKARKLK